jgi:hypothetical protein
MPRRTTSLWAGRAAICRTPSAPGREWRGDGVAVWRVLDRSGQRARPYSGPARSGWIGGGTRRCCGRSRWTGSWNSIGCSTGSRFATPPWPWRRRSPGCFRTCCSLPPRPGGEAQPWRPELTERHMAALDPHMVSRAIRDLLLDKDGHRFSVAAFRRAARLTASQAFLREAARRTGMWRGTPHAAAAIRRRDVLAGGQPMTARLRLARQPPPARPALGWRTRHAAGSTPRQCRGLDRAIARREEFGSAPGARTGAAAAGTHRPARG